jgi:pimeloyl-ACP methyl ester carboxylesterase
MAAYAPWVTPDLANAPLPGEAPRIVLGHGASGSAASMAPHVAGLRARGIDARAIDVPRGRTEAAVSRFTELLDADPDLAVGGHSFGGRMASLAAAGQPARALVLLSYPLHAPGLQAAWEDRTDHWPAIVCPVLLLSGEADPFARVDLLRQAVTRLPVARLVTWPRLGHGLGPVLDEALDLVAAFLRDPG